MERRTKTIISSIIAGVFILAAVFIPLTFFVFLKETALSQPNTPIVTQTSTKLSVQTNEVEGAQRYLFKIIAPSGSVIDIFSETPSIYIEMLNRESDEPINGFAEAGEYSVTCVAIAKKTILDSEPSFATTFKRYIQLKKPAPIFFTQNGTPQLRWESVKSATAYELHINSIAHSEVYALPVSSNTSSIETVALTDIFEELNLPNGEYQLILVAKNTDNNYFLKSNYSNSILFKFE